MAVYTQLSHQQIEQFLTLFDLPDLNSFRGIADGSDNSTYFLTCGDSAEENYVLSVYEQQNMKQLGFSLTLMAELNNNGLPVPAPISSRDQNLCNSLADKPCYLTAKAIGNWSSQPSVNECSEIGHFLGKLHSLSSRRTFSDKLASHDQANKTDLYWFSQACEQLQSLLTTGENALLSEQLLRARQMSEQGDELPIGIIHGDLFRDNALFHNNSLTAVIDFAYACKDWYLMDVAIAVNDWCSDSQGQLKREECEALLNAYSSERPFQQCERQYWQDMLCYTATLFWASRLLSTYFPEDPKQQQFCKPPEECYKRLKQRLICVPALP